MKTTEALDQLELTRQYMELVSMACREAGEVPEAVSLGILTAQDSLDRLEGILNGTETSAKRV